MPGQDQHVQMPDNTYVRIPGNATPDRLAQFRTKLSGQQKQQDPLVTGKGTC
jgi:hypothetical protein